MTQEFYETGSKEVRHRAAELRNLGYRIIVSSMGQQVTRVGVVKTTMITIINDDELPPSTNDYRSLGV